LRSILRNCGHDWQFTVQQKEQLQRYYAANKFLIECMYQPGAVNETVRGEIEDNLFLPITFLDPKKINSTKLRQLIDQAKKV